MIGVPSRGYQQHAMFWDYYNLLEKPDKTVCSVAHGQSPAASRNKMIEAALEHDCTHIFFLDDDMQFAPDTLTKLLAHDVDIVSGYYLMRPFPHQGLIFDYAEPDGKCHWYEIRDDETGLRETSAAGLGCVLFKTHVFEALDKPWVRLGEIDKDEWCDDIGLFNRIRQAGFKIHMDLDVQCGHMTNAIIKPIRRNGTWHVEIGTFGSESVSFPMIRRQNV